jgi:hypothetical protein
MQAHSGLTPADLTGLSQADFHGFSADVKPLFIKFEFFLEYFQHSQIQSV